ncbi:MAG: DNA-directed RNA polymerase subunit omega [Thermodesulfobacterium sp.]|uniref:DNA-directed RNA polymerase subunit omega n=1 Tax=Candidatus Thermodesulfobacterium syntrophicum TaxID=3060442 RepID=A0AAE3P426_9BACT|nr:DNA-directed RNA polymerase subunit omega [Thermodesulfobacterium sp.]MCD6548412.1 DNA-directed RNA polymerase subunit omega [Thermodesulfobacterium sp.]MDF2953605.1 DNA-directed RNA polymerase [Candidatus Thermodesulfobacterium syntrophicum]HEA84335.1 DNA-directed RNA polymerase subunit omega [Thermodesulfobacterium geofontis]
MARITVEDCLKKIPSRFRLIHLTIKRVKQLREGAQPLVECNNREIVTALREIAAGLVTPENIKELDKKEKVTSPYEISEILKQKSINK